jgi:hypothetical protein
VIAAGITVMGVDLEAVEAFAGDEVDYTTDAVVP